MKKPKVLWTAVADVTSGINNIRFSSKEVTTLLKYKIPLKNMPTRAYWQFYKEVLPFVIVFTLLGKIIFGSATALAMFLILGIAIGFLAFYLLKKDQFYFYYNLGLTKWKLFKAVFVINLIVGTPVIILLLIISSFLFGNSSVI